MSKFKVGDLVRSKIGNGQILEYAYRIKYTNDDYAGFVSTESELELVKERELTTPEYCEEPKTETKEWPCEHIGFGERGWWFLDCVKSLSYEVSTQDNYCRKCGAKRPEPKEETLNSFIKKTYDEIDDHYEGHFERSDYMAKAIREHIRSKEGEIVRLLEAVGFLTQQKVTAKQILRVLGVG